MQYFLGDFDGEKFLCTYPSDEPRWLDEGFDNYAAVTFQNAKDVLLMGWGMNWQYAAQTPTEGYCGQATLARKLSLTRSGRRSDPRGCPGRTGKIPPQQLSDREPHYDPHRDLWTEGLRKGRCKNLSLKNSVGQKLKIYVTDTEITVDRTMAGYKEFSEHFMTEKYSISTAARKKDGAWNLELVFDVSILELFAEDGVDAISTVVYPETPYDRVSWKGDLSVELYEIDA
jgi:fructan beta-fructosidase